MQEAVDDVLAKSLGYTNSASTSTRLNSGGSFGYVRLKVTPESEKYNNIKYVSGFDTGVLTGGVLRPTGSTGWKEADGVTNVFAEGVKAIVNLIRFPNNPDA